MEHSDQGMILADLGQATDLCQMLDNGEKVVKIFSEKL
jgi:hypothetical protein